MEKTITQYDLIIDQCKDIFLKKNTDYGTSWRVLRLSSLTDQMFIKARRIRTIEEKETSKIDDSVELEFMGLINYGIMALIQSSNKFDVDQEIPIQLLAELYDQNVMETKELMLKKNHDYGEVWRDMRVSSMTDLILVKLLRIKQIEDNQGVTILSEGSLSNYQDIINYAIFALIKLEEKKTVE